MVLKLSIERGIFVNLCIYCYGQLILVGWLELLCILYQYNYGLLLIHFHLIKLNCCHKQEIWFKQTSKRLVEFTGNRSSTNFLSSEGSIGNKKKITNIKWSEFAFDSFMIYHGNIYSFLSPWKNFTQRKNSVLIRHVEYLLFCVVSKIDSCRKPDYQNINNVYS